MPHRSESRARFLVREEAGITLVETLVAAIILVTGLLAALQAFDTSTRTTFRAEESQVAVNVAQRELEEIRNLDYNQVALTSTPSGSSDPDDPRNRVSGPQFDLNDDGNMADLVINGGPLDEGGQVAGGLVNPGPEEFQSGDVSGQIYRFVVWRNDPHCTPTQCPGFQDLKRVVVAVKLDPAPISYERPYIEVHSDFIDPEESALGNPPEPGGEDVVAQQFWLSDTTCDHPQRQDIALDPPGSDGHPLHNTLGTCDSALQIGATPGAADALLRSQPPDPSPADPGDPPLYDYANDLEPTAIPPDADKGLQLARQDQAGCDFAGDGDDAPQEVHRWMTGPLPVAFDMRGDATLELYTRTLGEAVHPGEICVFLFQRHDLGLSTATDTPIPLTSASAESRPDETWQCGLETPDVGCATSTWPSDRWAQLRIELEFTQVPVPLDDRLGLAIAVERDGTTADAVQFAYDHPDFRARLEVDTTTPLDE
jgi:type II secretory pathway pseudopilin PulG